MRTAGAFALPREDALFSRAGFATRPGEYLASGRPVIASATRDVEFHLMTARDRVHTDAERVAGKVWSSAATVGIRRV